MLRALFIQGWSLSFFVEDNIYLLTERWINRTWSIVLFLKIAVFVTCITLTRIILDKSKVIERQMPFFVWCSLTVKESLIGQKKGINSRPIQKVCIINFCKNKSKVFFSFFRDGNKSMLCMFIWIHDFVCFSERKKIDCYILHVAWKF